jgi:hypothetical protein
MDGLGDEGEEREVIGLFHRTYGMTCQPMALRKPRRDVITVIQPVDLGKVHGETGQDKPFFLERWELLLPL